MKKLECKSVKGLLGIIMVIGALVFGNVPIVAAEDAEKTPPEDKPTVNAYVDVLSQYIFRGVALSADSAVIQPSATVGYKGFSLNIWGNLDTDQAIPVDNVRGANWNETDITFAYSREIVKNLTATVGTVYYGIVGQDSLEVMAGMSYAFPFITVAVTGYREVWHFPGWWLQFDLTHTFNLPWYGMTVDTGATFGYLDSEKTYNAGWGGEFDGFLSGQVLAQLNIPIGKYFSVSPKIGLAFPLSDEAARRISLISWDGQDTHVFGGIRLSASF